jgi:hypothetical protein
MTAPHHLGVTMKKTEAEKKVIDEVLTVVFTKTYVGDLGVFFKGMTYELTGEEYEALKSDCRGVV